MKLYGSCNCKAVQFTVIDPVDATACHCGQCRKQSGNYWASSDAPVGAYEITGNVQWYEASALAKRGFCPICGSFLFWKRHDEDKMSFSLGAIDGGTGQKVEQHIFTEDKGDYYDLPAPMPQKEGS